MITWVAPPSPRYKVLPNILASKGRLLAGEDLSGFVNRQMKDLMSKVRTFDLVRRADTVIGGLPAIELIFSMKPQGVVLMQRQAFFIVPTDPVTAQTVVATAAKEDWPALEAEFDGIFQTLRWQG